MFNFIAWITGKPQLANCFKETRFPFPLLPGNDSHESKRHFTHEFSWILSVVINCEVSVVKIAWFQQVRVCDDSVYYPRLKFKFKVISQIKHIWHLLSILTRTQWTLWVKYKLWNLWNDSHESKRHFTHEFSWILSVVINCEVSVVKIAWFQQVRVCDDSVYYPRLKFKFKVISQIKHIWHLLSILTRTQWTLWVKHKLWNLSCKAKHYSVREWS